MKHLIRLLLAYCSLLIGLHLYFRSRSLTTPRPVSHRGAAGLAPENTLSSMMAAVAHNAAIIEFDVQRTRDGTLVLLHDNTVNRTTNGRGRIKNMTLADLRQLDAGRHFGPAFAGEKIPTLEEVLHLLKPSEATLALELKSPANFPNIEPEAAAIIRASGLAHRTILVSFNGRVLQRIADLIPEASAAFVAIYPVYIPKGITFDTVGVFWPSALLDPTLIHRLHKNGYMVWVWTVNHPWLMRLLLWLGVDGITTDRPDIWNQVTTSRPSPITRLP